MRGEVHILVYCPIDTLQWGSTHSALIIHLHTHLVNKGKIWPCAFCRSAPAWRFIFFLTILHGVVD